jgi:hypothetical protein
VLEIGAVGDTVTVEGSATLFETETSAAGQVLSGDQLLKIPVSQKRAIRIAGGVDYYNRSLEKAVASYNITHRFVHLMSYELPFGSGRQFFNKNRFANQVIGGWELTWTQTLQSGLPFNVGYSNSPNRYLPTGAQRPNILTDTAQAQVQNWGIGANRFPTSAQNPYLNIASFDYPAAFTVGNLGRNAFIGPGLNWTQLSIAKAWSFRERVRFQLRLDANNFPFKQPQYANPNSTFDGATPVLSLASQRRAVPSRISERRTRICCLC